MGETAEFGVKESFRRAVSTERTGALDSVAEGGRRDDDRGAMAGGTGDEASDAGGGYFSVVCCVASTVCFKVVC